MAQGIAILRATAIPPGSFGENLEAESEEEQDKCLNTHDDRDARKLGFEDGRMKSLIRQGYG